MTILLQLILLAAGFALLLRGADALVVGASSLARRLGVSNIVIGLTVVAFGTSMPELIVNVFASLRNAHAVVLGNIVGSNFANIALILGIAAIIVPLAVQSATVWKEIPLAVLSIVLVVVMGNDVMLDGVASNVIGRADGLVLLSFFVVFLYYVFGLVKDGNGLFEQKPELVSGRRTAILVILGLVALGIGGKLVVDAATALAKAVGIPSRVIALTVVAVGTSLPELATSVVAALRKNADIAVGNIIGSNIFNVFLVLGVSAVISPIPVARIVMTDVAATVAISALLFAFMFIGRKHVLDRWQGAFLVSLYLMYTASLFFIR